MKSLIGLCLGLLLAAAPAHAQMAESLKHQMHSEKDLGAQIVTERDLDRLEALTKDPGVKILCLQLWPEAMNATRAKLILDWVRSGKTVWIYDVRLGPWFGFEPCLMTKDQFSNKPESGELGGKSTQGVATVALAMGIHPVVTGVGQVTVYLPLLNKDQYGALWVKGDTVPLLRFTSDSPAVSAVRREGRGAIFYKPLLWPEALSGDRFQSNVLEFSAGYQVPGPAGTGKVGNPPGPKAEYMTGDPATPLQADSSVTNTTPSNATSVNGTSGNATVTNQPKSKVEYAGDKVESGGETLVGRVVTETFRFETGSQSLVLTRKDIKEITLGGNIGLDSVLTWDGKLRKGILVSPSIQIDVNGQVRKIEKRNLQKIELAAAPSGEEKNKP